MSAADIGDRYAVLITKMTTGAVVEFASYGTESEAQAVAAHLVAVGCPARVEIAKPADVADGARG